MVRLFVLLVLAGAAIFTTPASAATMEDEVRAVFDKYISAQNNHDLKSMRTLLIQDPPLHQSDDGQEAGGVAHSEHPSDPGPSAVRQARSAAAQRPDRAQ